MSTPTSTDTGGRVGDTAGAAKDSAGSVASSAGDHARDLAGTATDKASQVADEAKSQARDLLGETRDQVRTEAENRRGQAVSSLRAVGDELDAMQQHDGQHGWATEVVSRGTSYVRQTADWLESRQPNEILDDVRRFARERPGTFLVGALFAGLLAGRMTRAVKAGPPDSTGAGSNGAVSNGAVNSPALGGGSSAGAYAEPTPAFRHEAAEGVSAPSFASSQGAAPTQAGVGDAVVGDEIRATPAIDPVEDPAYVPDELTTPLPNRPGGLA